MATRTKTRTALDRLRELEAAEAEAREKSRALASEHHEKVQEERALRDRRAKLVHREPGLVDHLDAPLDADGEVARIDKEVADLGDLHDLAARAKHARQLERRAREDVQRFIEAHFEQIVGELVPEAEEVAKTANERLADAAEALGSYIAFCQRVMAYLGTVRRDTRLVTGFDPAADRKRALDRWADLPAPLPSPRAETPRMVTR